MITWPPDRMTTSQPKYTKKVITKMHILYWLPRCACFTAMVKVQTELVVLGRKHDLPCDLTSKRWSKDKRAVLQSNQAERLLKACHNQSLYVQTLWHTELCSVYIDSNLPSKLFDDYAIDKTHLTSYCRDIEQDFQGKSTGWGKQIP